jgi:hypothetical protein
VIAVVGRGDVADDGPGNCGASRGKMDLRIFEPIQVCKILTLLKCLYPLLYLWSLLILEVIKYF